MDKASLARRKARVERLLADRGYNVTSAAIAAGLNPHFIRQWLSGRVASPGAEKLKLIAGLLGITVDELTFVPPEGVGDSAGADFDARYPSTVLRPKRGDGLIVRHVVQAGAWLEVDDIGQERLAGPPVTADHRFDPDLQWLELVRGDSVDLVYPEGAWVHVVDAVGIGYAPRDEDFVVVERKRQQEGLIERSLKQIAVTRRKIELWPRSRNPKWKAPLVLEHDSDDTTTVEIAALVLGGYLPARR